MERGKRSEAINGEIQLPEAIIQQIQSLLNGKEAAQTSVISKSWYNAWLTNPNLDFDQRNFRIGDSESEAAERFPNFVKKTMQRSHLKASWFHELKRLLTELIPSKVSLNLRFSKEERIDHIKGLPRPVSENLILSSDTLSSMYFSAFLDAIFWSCRPKVITVYGFNGSCLLELLCNRLMQQVNENYWIPDQTVFGQDGLEEVSFESFEVTLKSGGLCPGKLW
ncbi:hypothetical protein BUALT_Bualt14G0081200 [Buddleja alternifolia]|uniref:F-box domain-containing protein n=1 Tax=Buddleja alternifolia TaxID=168488 RepID=A0AAV6WT21_9LAMI|nr:hypothetical protein BUALT_Bualt14G0081200 [Buddleja alternifolia]